MKKLSLILACILLALSITGCTGTPVIYMTNCDCPENPVTAPAPAPVPVEGDLKTGLAIVGGAKESKSAAEGANGEAKYDVTIVAVTVDANGVIASCIIDSVGASLNFDAAGQIVSDVNAAIKTKNELKEDYNMKKYAGSKYEWYEQAASFSKYVTGKTFDEVAGIAVTESTKPAEADLASTVTIAVGGFKGLIAKAAN